jgi:Arm DNA-binding domain
MAKLTKRIVDAASPREVPYFIWCSELSGFGVRVHPTGKRVYYADYRNKQGVRKRLAIGPHGKLTTEEARKLALGILGGVIRGEEPAERGSRMTMAELCSNYMAVSEQGAPFGKRRQPKKPSTLRHDQARIQRHIIPLLGSKRWSDRWPLFRILQTDTLVHRIDLRPSQIYDLTQTATCQSEQLYPNNNLPRSTSIFSLAKSRT